MSVFPNSVLILTTVYPGISQWARIVAAVLAGPLALLQQLSTNNHDFSQREQQQLQYADVNLFPKT